MRPRWAAARVSASTTSLPKLNEIFLGAKK